MKWIEDDGGEGDGDDEGDDDKGDDDDDDVTCGDANINNSIYVAMVIMMTNDCNVKGDARKLVKLVILVSNSDNNIYVEFDITNVRHH